MESNDATWCMREPVGRVPHLGNDRAAGADQGGSRSHENTSHTFNFGSSDVVQNIDRTSPSRFPLSFHAACVTNVGGSEDRNAAARVDREERQREAAELHPLLVVTQVTRQGHHHKRFDERSYSASYSGRDHDKVWSSQEWEADELMDDRTWRPVENAQHTDRFIIEKG